MLTHYSLFTHKRWCGVHSRFFQIGMWVRKSQSVCLTPFFLFFFFMSYREGPLLACSSRQGSPLLRKALSERGWETPSPSPCIDLLLPVPNGYIIQLLKIQPKSLCKQKDKVYILLQFMYLHLPHLRREMDSTCSYCTAVSHFLQAG